jgi:hypothetical protein
VSRLGLARVWAILGALLAIYATGTWIILQGGKYFTEMPGLEGRAPVTSAYQAVLIIGVLLGVLSAVGLQYMRTTKSVRETLLPVVAIDNIGPHEIRSWSMRLYQSFFFIIFLIVPAVSLYQLNMAVLQRGVLWHQDDPALGGIALKNAFDITRGTSDQDKKEHACVNEVTRSDGFVWLSNTRCDVVKANRLKPFEKSGKSIVENAESSAPTCTRELAITRSKIDACENTRDMSEECERSERHCRGMQWLPVISPLLLAASTLFGWAMFVWLTVEACYRTIHRVPREAGEIIA